MHILRSPDDTTCTEALFNRLTDELNTGKRVLWFVTGGSNVSVDIAVMNRLDNELTKNLTITLTDERHGDYGHPDSNWQQLLDGGFDSKQARIFPVLQLDNQSLEQTTRIYATNLDVALDEAEVVIGFYGLGNDGHIAGILPNSVAVDAQGSATGYQTEQFNRITTTFETIRRCDVAYMYAGGADKLEPLQNLAKDIALAEQPAQVLKQISEAYIYNDQTGE
jgi:6-phosphogluconolactonase/glucosamine-6-phosphate isomerase/deaminase